VCEVMERASRAQSTMRGVLHQLMRHAAIPLAAGWVLWIGSANTSASTGPVLWFPRDGYETRAQCSAAQQVLETRMVQEKASSTIVACFPDVFDPRANAAPKAS
jgi:hypothetical protein